MFATAAITDIWLNDKGQDQGLRSILDNDLVLTMGMRPQEHHRFDPITPNRGERFAHQHFLEIAGHAHRVCAHVASGYEAILYNSRLARRFTR